MIHSLLGMREAEVSALLERPICRSVEQVQPGRWDLVLKDKGLPVKARVKDNWLCLTASAAGPNGTNWDLLRRNAALPGLTKFAIAPYATTVSLRAEIPLGEDIDANWYVEDTLRGLAAALTLKPATIPTGGREETLTPETEATDWRLENTCREAGWQVHPRAGRRLAADLELPRGCHEQAILEELPSGRGIRISAPLLETGALADPCRRAVADLLLRVCGGVRMARAVVFEAEGRADMQCEVTLTCEPRAEEVDHALSALTAAVAASEREARALCDERIAVQYLAMWTGDSEPEPQMPPRVGRKEKPLCGKPIQYPGERRVSAENVDR